MITTYNVISNNGYIAREDSSEDFIPDEAWVDFIEQCHTHDVVVLGRKTYESIQDYDPRLIEVFEKLPIKKVIVTNNREYIPKADYIVAHSPEDAIKLGNNVLVSSGPIINSFLLKKRLINKVMLNVLPDEIPSGIKPFYEHLDSFVGLAETVVSKMGKRRLVIYRVLPPYSPI